MNNKVTPMSKANNQTNKYVSVSPFPFIMVGLFLNVKQVIEQQQQDVPHIMISYNWGVQPLVLKLAATLKAAGFKVWLDVEQMRGSTLEASKF